METHRSRLRAKRQEFFPSPIFRRQRRHYDLIWASISLSVKRGDWTRLRLRSLPALNSGIWKDQKLSKFTSANLHSLPNLFCHLLLCTSDYFSIFLPSVVSFPGASLKTPGWGVGDWSREINYDSLWGSGLRVSPTSLVVCKLQSSKETLLSGVGS